MKSFILLLFVDLTLADTQSLKYFYTGSSGVTEFPEFVVVGLVNDEQFVYFDKNINRMIPRQEWMAKSEGPSYWDGQTQGLIGSAQNFKANLGILKERFNETGGIHTLQFMYGCIKYDDDTTGMFRQFAYDGNDFISFDVNTLSFTATSPQAAVTKKKWEENEGFVQFLKNYYQKECFDWLNKYVKYGRSTLERKVRPEVQVYHKPADHNAGTEVTCHVTGFFPRDIAVTWNADGSQDLDMESGEVLPNEDGTYQLKKKLKLNPEEVKSKTYTCQVDHSSLSEKFNVVWDPNMKRYNEKDGSNLQTFVIVGVLVGLVVIGAIIFGVVWKKKKTGAKTPGYVAAQRDDSSSSSSNTA